MTDRTRKAVITGAAQGIGRALARHFLDEGWAVVGLDRDAEALDEFDAGPHTARWAPEPVDVSREDDVVAAFARVRATGTALDLLVNNAGPADASSGPLEELTVDAWRHWIDGHLTGAFLCTREAVPLLRSVHGSIVNIASTRALQSEPDSEAYAAAKGGLLALTHAAAISLGPAVRVNAICPGWIETAHLKKASRREEPRHRPIDREQHPVGRVGEVGDVVEAVEYLATAGFVTGQTLIVDGGMTRRMIYAP